MRKFVCERYPIDKLPRDLHPQLPEGRHVRVVIEDDISDEEILAELDGELAKGLRSLDEGRGIPIEEVERRLVARFGRAADAVE
jgi:hypothetical protein